MELIEQHQLEVISVVGADMNGIPRGKKFPAARFDATASSPMRISNLVSILDAGSFPITPPEGDDRWWPSWSEGFGDTRAVIDPSTARVVPWQAATGLVICDFERVDDGGVLEFLPRCTLRRLSARLQEAGFDGMAAAELEFMLFRETEQSLFEKGFRDLTPLWHAPQAYTLTTLGRHEGVLRVLRDQLEGFDLPIECWGIEAGPGQVEMNLPPRDPLRAADDAFLFKHAVKELAASMELTATFIPKLAAGSFGNGNHLNFSLWRDGSNAFHASEPGEGIPEVLRHFVAGVVHTLPEFTLLYAPFPVSYRRFVPYYLQGLTQSWGFDNRSVSVRIVTESEARARIELRTAGADVNPYCLLAGCIAGGLYGLEQRLQPGPASSGDAYADPALVQLPTNIDDALRLFADSDIANGYLGEDFVRFYTQTRHAEVCAFRAALGERAPDAPVDAVSDWEIKRYFLVA